MSEAYAAQAQELALLRPKYDSSLAVNSSKIHVQTIHDVSTVFAEEGDLGSNRVATLAQRVTEDLQPISSANTQEAVESSSDQASKLLKILTYTSDEESLLLLARLRLGEAWSTILESLPTGLPFIDPAFHQVNAHSADRLCQASTLTAETIDITHTKTHVIQTTDRLRDQQQDTPFAQTMALAAAKPWLTEIFDRQYFMQVGYIYHTPRPALLPGGAGSQSSFGNMPFSSAIAANYYPAHIQETQQHNFLVPIWAQRVLNGATIHADPFQDIMTELMNDIANGVTVEELCGSHPYIEALDSAETFHRAPKLSKIAARTIASIKTMETSSTFTQYAMMYWFWALWRWMLCPNKETYAAIPEFAKPTTSQLFVSHPPVFDFILPPGLRDLMCRDDTPNIQWFTEAAITIECHWSGSGSAAVCRDGITNEIDFNPICKVSEPKLHAHLLNTYTLCLPPLTVSHRLTRKLDTRAFSQIIPAEHRIICQDQMREREKEAKRERHRDDTTPRRRSPFLSPSHLENRLPPNSLVFHANCQSDPSFDV